MSNNREMNKENIIYIYIYVCVCVCVCNGILDFLGDSISQESVCNAGDLREVLPLGQEDPLEKRMANLSSILAWRIPWIKEPGKLQSMRLQRVGQD